MLRTFSHTQILKDFQAQCQTLATNSNEGYRKEFEELNDVGKEFPTKAGLLEANIMKNRYPFILPYDHCRVKLSVLQSQPHSDYINASFVPGGCSEHDFICTQGPLKHTIADFWRMVWEHNVHVIVMLTPLKENDRVLCDQYWPPERGTGCYGDIQVTTAETKRWPDSNVTIIHLRKNGFPDRRRVTHYMFTSWPDMSVPRDPSSLCAFTENVREHLDRVPPLNPAIVHCSAGIGRSGAFITILWLLQLCIRGVPPDVRAAVRDLRQHRVQMVQTLEQYIFIHKCLLRWLLKDSKELKSRSQSAPMLTQQQTPFPRSGGSQSTSTKVKGPPKRLRSSPSVLQSFSAQFQNSRAGHLFRRLLPSSDPELKDSHSNL